MLARTLIDAPRSSMHSRCDACFGQQATVALVQDACKGRFIVPRHTMHSRCFSACCKARSCGQAAFVCDARVLNTQPREAA